MNYWQILVYGFSAHVTRYLLIAGAAYLLFYVCLRRKLIRRKIQSMFPRPAEMRREVVYSLLSFAVFGVVGVLTAGLFQAGWTRLYFNLQQHGAPYFWLSVIALIFVHDTWFYWSHRLMHWRRLFAFVHRIHHLSHNPTPWAAFAFHPLEALVQALIFPLVILLLPLHPLAALAWLFYMTVMNVLGHLGFEILPRGFARHWLFKWHNTSLHHNMHHRHVNCNYGLYFNLWDRLMRTNHRRYEETYDEITGASATEHARFHEFRDVHRVR